MADAVYSTSSLKAQNAQPYRSMAGRLQPPLLKALDSMGYEFMTPVQQKVLTELPSLSSDCLVQAKTGTGKTIAFLLPALNSVLTQQNVPRGQVGILIVSPTRELALQIAKECDQLTTQLPRKLECHTAFGGTRKETHLKQFLNGNPTVLVATPGRLNDYLSDEYVAGKFSNVRTVILDEADTMLEAGFLPAINEILRRLPNKTTGWQGMCFSATMPEKIKTVLGRILRPGYTHLTTVDQNETPTIDLVTQYSVIVPSIGDVLPSLYALIEQERQLSPNSFKAIVFGNTANGVALLHDIFQKLYGSSMKIYELQSRLSQSARTRTTEEFKQVSSGLLFASDVIGRGMDFQGVGVVIQVGLPSSGEQYVHRVGRTARAGNEGRAIIILTDREQYFLRVNKNLPIQPYPYNVSGAAANPATAEALQQATYAIDDYEKTTSKAYQAYLGFHKSFTKQLRLDNAGLVAVANEYAASLGRSEPPVIDRQVVGKMGLKGVQGLNVGVVDKGPGRGGGGGGGGRVSKPAGSGGPSMRQPSKIQRGVGQGRKGGRSKQHQGPPGSADT